MATSLKNRQSFHLEKSVTYRLHTLSKITDRISQTAYVEDAGIPLSEGRCLAAIGTFVSLSVNDLASKANLDKGQASRAAQSLVNLGLVIKTASPTDRRGVFLELSAKGQKVWGHLSTVIKRRNEEIVACLSSVEVDHFNGILDKLLDHARQAASKLNNLDDTLSDQPSGTES
jgi:DNA-binding MarR family transcriptional regulator